METVVTPVATRWTVEHFAGEIRKSAYLWTDVRLLGMEFIKVFAENRYPGTELEDLQAIRNILAAVEIVRAERMEA